MKPFVVGLLMTALVPAAAFGAGPLPAPVVQAAVPAAAPGTVVLEYTAPTSGTWGPTAGALPTHAFGLPAQVLQVVPGGYTVRQELPVERGLQHAEYVAKQLGHSITVVIPDPAGGPPYIMSVGRDPGDFGR